VCFFQKLVVHHPPVNGMCYLCVCVMFTGIVISSCACEFVRSFGEIVAFVTYKWGYNMYD